jgi:hypothetical protein
MCVLERGSCVLSGFCVLLCLRPQTPELKLLDVTEMNMDMLKMSFAFNFEGNAVLKLLTTIQVCVYDRGRVDEKEISRCCFSAFLLCLHFSSSIL